MPSPRRAAPDDLDRIVAMGVRFHTPGQWHGLVAFDEASFRASVAGILERGAIFLTDDGVIALVLTPSLYNHAAVLCAEAFFWAPDGQGDALRAAAEAWGRRHASVLVMSSHGPGEPRQPVIDRWYRRAGYLPMTHQFAKALTWDS